MLSMYSYADCPAISFKENYLSNFQKNEVFFIKGVALNVFEYGRTIEVIEDIKGNFTDKSFVFVWGGGVPSGGSYCPISERSDNITYYNENDTLIMLVGKTYQRCDGGIENPEDYVTPSCALTVLKLSNGYVTGYISPWEDAVLWEELQKELQTLYDPAAIQSVKIKNNIYQWNGTIFFENTENKAIELLFYDLLGKLVYQTITTSNSYRPVLTGNVFVCKININNKLQTIKYIVP